MKQSIAKNGTDHEFHVWTPHVKLSFDEYGGLIFFNGWADNHSLNSNSGIDVTCDVTGQRVRGTAVMKKAREFFDTSYRFELNFDTVMIATVAAWTAEVDATPFAAQAILESPIKVLPHSLQAKDLPFPPDARKIVFDETFDEVEFNSSSTLESLLAFYRLQMPARGWTENPDAATQQRNRVELTFQHRDNELGIELSTNSDGSVDASFDCDELLWSEIHDPAGLVAAGVPQPRSHLLLQDLPRPDDAFDVEFEDGGCEFKSAFSAKQAAEFYVAQMIQHGWTAVRARPLITDNLCRLEYEKEEVTLDFTIFSNRNPTGSRISVEYESEAPEQTIAPLGRVAARTGTPDQIDGRGSPAASAAPLDFSSSRGTATVTYGSETHVLKNVVAYQQEMYGRDRVLVEFCSLRIPYEKMQQRLSEDEEFAFYEFYQRSTPVQFGLFLSDDRTSISFSKSGISIGGHRSEYIVRDIRVEAGRLVGTVKMNQADKVLSRPLQFEADLDVPIMRPASWPPAAAEEISLH